MLNPYQSPWEPSPPKKTSPPRVMDALARGMLEGLLLGGACGGTAAGVLSAAWEVMHPNPTPGLPLFVVGSMFAGVIGAMAGLVIGPAVVVLRKIWLSDRRELVMFIAAAVCGMVGAVLGLMEGGLLSMGESEPTSTAWQLSGALTGGLFGILGGVILGYQRSPSRGSRVH